GVAACPVAGFGERLAGRPADQQIDLAGFEPALGQQLLGRQIEDAPLDDGARAMLPQRLAAIVVEVRRDGDVESCRLDPVIEATAAAVEADRYEPSALHARVRIGTKII